MSKIDYKLCIIDFDMFEDFHVALILFSK